MNEIWKPVPSLVGYEASSIGRIKSSNGTVLRPYTNELGYQSIPVYIPKQTTKQVNRLVCEAFHGPAPTPKHQSAHWDGNPSNNTPENLRWATNKENSDDKRRHGTHKIGSQIPVAKFTEESAGRCLLKWQQGFGVTSLAVEFNVSVKAVRCLVAGKTWTHAHPEIPRRADTTAEVEEMAFPRSHDHYGSRHRTSAFHRVDKRGLAMCHGHVVDRSRPVNPSEVPVSLQCRRCSPWPKPPTPPHDQS